MLSKEYYSSRINTIKGAGILNFVNCNQRIFICEVASTEERKDNYRDTLANIIRKKNHPTNIQTPSQNGASRKQAKMKKQRPSSKS